MNNRWKYKRNSSKIKMAKTAASKKFLNSTPRITRSKSGSSGTPSTRRVADDNDNEMTNAELRNLIDSLRNEVSSLNRTVENLENKVENLELKLSSYMISLNQTNATLAVSQITSGHLKDEVDRLQQYSRRNCLVVEGVNANKSDTSEMHLSNMKSLLSNEFPEDKEIDNKQRMIVRFTKHSVVRRIYQKRKDLKNSNLSFHPSLTRTRSDCLKKCQQMVSSIPTIKFVFADIEGNLKACFEKPLRGKNIHQFVINMTCKN